MFPLEFPLGVLRRQGRKGQRVLDPFCGRGTTNYAARLLGLNSLGVDSNPVAAAITAAKLVAVSPGDIVSEARAILVESQTSAVPQGEFWHWGFHPTTLEDVCRLRAALVSDCITPARIALRGILLGALHGPRQKTFQSYFSNQCPRTYAPKPGYATSYWRERWMRPQKVDVLAVIERRASRCYSAWMEPLGSARLGDSRRKELLQETGQEALFDWVITSPPYYGMRTYVPDQWLRYWLLGGPDDVVYQSEGQLRHRSPELFASELRHVWQNAAAVSGNAAKLVIRFGGISDRRAAPKEIAAESLRESGWRVVATRSAGNANAGRRQADAFLSSRSSPIAEIDIWARRD
jgi:hypothetical protein